MMQGLARYRPYALLCAVLLLVCILASHPVAETGINDDFSYVKSAQLMSTTGHMAYVGWASAMEGWLIPLGALFIKLFGFSFTGVRAAGVLVATVTAVLMQRSCVRSGLSERNAAIATLAIVLSPLYLPLASTYMTDIPGLLVVVLCYYGCLRAVESATGHGATAWLTAICVLTAIGGTARQTGWLGLFLMVPCACLLLRRRRMPWLVVAAVWVASVVFLFAALRWFAHQPYSLGESLVRGYFDRDFVYHFLSNALRAGLAVCFFLVPLTLAFVAELPLGNPRARRVVYFAAAGTALAAAFLLATHQFLSWQAPFVGTYVVNDGVEHPMTVGDRPVLLRPFTRVLLSLFTFAGTVATLAYCAARGKIRTQAQAPAHPAPSSTRPPWRMVLILLLPFTAVYTALLVHRALFDRVYDRYLLELLFVGAVLLARLYQDEVRSRLPAVTVAAVALSAIFSVAANHDLFSAERARLGAAQELIQAGVDRDRFLAGWEYDSWTQIDHYGFVNTGNIRLPTGYYVQRPIPYSISPRPCNDGWAPDFPAIHPQYVLSFDATSCDGPSGFAPVEYHAWLPPFRREMYIRRVVVPGQ